MGEPGSFVPPFPEGLVVMPQRKARDLQSPHDGLFRAVFERADSLRGECLAVLPREVCEALDFKRVEVLPAHFVDEAFRSLESDALFRVPGRDGGAFISVLLEHQRSNDALMPWRLLKYLTAIWTRVMDGGRKRVPPILPIVIANVPGGWRGPTSFHEGDRGFVETITRWQPGFEFILDDLHAVSSQALLERRSSPFAKLALWMMRTAQDEARFAAELGQWRDTFLSVSASAPTDLRRAMVYLVASTRMKRADLRALIGTTVGAEVERTMVTWQDIAIAGILDEREDWERYGMAKGRKEGEAKGEAKGMAKESPRASGTCC